MIWIDSWKYRRDPLNASITFFRMKSHFERVSWGRGNKRRPDIPIIPSVENFSGKAGPPIRATLFPGYGPMVESNGEILRRLSIDRWETVRGNGQPRRRPVAESVWPDKNCYDRLMLHRAKCWRYNIATCTIDAEAIDEISPSVQYLVPRRALRLSVTEFLRDSANSLVVNSISRLLRSLSLPRCR